MSGPEAVAVFMLIGGAVYVVRPVAAAIAKRIAGEHRRPEPDHAETEELRTELQQVRQELGELAERVDFTERLLAQQRDAALPRPRA
jgi:predicted ArsR family transcriptional regulator